MNSILFPNPFKPSAGHMPPYLAGRTAEQDEFSKFLEQTTVVDNLILTGLRGVGKTVLLQTLEPIARQAGWLWTGTDMSGSTSLTEERMATRLITDLSLLTSIHLSSREPELPMGFHSRERIKETSLGYDVLIAVYQETPGLVSDKLKAVLKFVWDNGFKGTVKGIVFAYDEAQIMADHEKQNEFPLSLILEIFQYLQRTGYPYLLILTGLPTLNAKLVAARTYSERMFHTIFLAKLDNESSRKAVTEPIFINECPIQFSEDTVDQIVNLSGGYPYLIQFICKEVFNVWIVQFEHNERPSVPVREILRKLDNDFFSARWDPVTDRQRQLMCVISLLENCDDEFSVQEVVQRAKETLVRPFSPSQINTMLVALGEKGLIFKNRHGKYSFAVPLLSQFIKRQINSDIALNEMFS